MSKKNKLKELVIVALSVIVVLGTAGCQKSEKSNSVSGEITATEKPSPTPHETEQPSPTPHETEQPSPTPQETEQPSPTPQETEQPPTPHETEQPPTPQEQKNESYPEPEEHVINGANTNVKGMSEVKEAVKKYAKENNIYLRYIETETDGSLYMEISCNKDTGLAKNISDQIASITKGCGYSNIIMLTYTDISKDENAANRVICDADIYPDGTVDIYNNKN